MKTHPKILILFIVFSGVMMKSGDGFEGTVGQTVEITCQIPDEHKHTPKYFCRRPCTSWNHVLIKTGETDKVKSYRRYSVIYTVDSKTFTVTIKNLGLSDSGVYYCGLNQWGPDTLYKVHLHVRPAAAFYSTQLSPTHTPKHTMSAWMTTHTSADDSSSTVHSSSSTSLVNVSVVCAGVLGLLVFWVLVALVLLYRRRSDSKLKSMNLPIPEDPDPADLNQTVEDVYRLHETMAEYSLVGRPTENAACLIYSTVQNCDPAPHDDVNAVYSLITQTQM